MIGIIVPAHNEEERILRCVQSALEAGRNNRLNGKLVEIVVVSDSCTDATEKIAARAGSMTLAIQARNVGMARAEGAKLMLARGAEWLAFTDADTIVSFDWLADQIALNADAVCGTVGVNEWTSHGENGLLLQSLFAETYRDIESHRHIHGANLGVTAAAYRGVGGFTHLKCSEDVALVRALELARAQIAWSALPRVTTSARRYARAAGGFGDALLHTLNERLTVAD